MELYELLEIRRGDSWVVGLIKARSDKEILVHIDSLETAITVKLKDCSDFRIHTSAKIGSEKILNTANFMDFDYVNRMIAFISDQNVLNKTRFNQFVRGKIYFCLLQLMGYNYNQHTNFLSTIQPMLHNIFLIYLKILGTKLRLVDEDNTYHENVYSQAYPEIESAFLIITGMEEPGTSFYRDYRNFLQLFSTEFEEMPLFKFAAIKIIQESQSIFQLHSNSDDLIPFIEILVNCSRIVQVSSIACEKKFNTTISEYLERTLRSPNFNFSRKNFSKIFVLLSHFNLNKEVICKMFLEFLQKDLTLNQTFEIFSSLDTIDDNELSKLIEYIDSSKVYLKTLKNEGLLKYLIKYIRLFGQKKTISHLFSEILGQIIERDIFLAFFKAVADNLTMLNLQDCLKILGLFADKYSGDSRFVVSTFINHSLSIYSFPEWYQVISLLYTKIPKIEAIKIIKNVILSCKDQQQFQKLILEILTKIDLDLSNELLLELINTNEFNTIFLNSDSIFEEVCALITVSSRTFTLLNCLLKFDFCVKKNETSVNGIKSKSKKVEGIVKNLFGKCLAEEKLIYLYINVVCQINDTDLLKEIMVDCLKDLNLKNMCESEEKLFLALFLKINSKSITFLDRFWERDTFVQSVYRKKKESLEYEENLFRLFFNEKLTNKSKEEFESLILALNTKFDTSAPWTKQVWVDFMKNLFLFPDTPRKFEFFYKLLQYNIGTDTKITIDQLIENNRKTENLSNDYKYLVYRRILQGIQDQKMQVEFILEYLKTSSDCRFNLILIERIAKIAPMNEIFSNFNQIIERLGQHILFSQIIFNMVSKKDEFKAPDFLIPITLFQNFLNVNTNLLSEEETRECFEAFFIKMNQLSIDDIIQLYNICLILIFTKDSLNHGILVEFLRKSLQTQIHQNIVNHFLNSYLKEERFIIKKISNEAEEIFDLLLYTENLPICEKLLIDHLYFNRDMQINENILALLLCVKSKQAKLGLQDNGYGCILMDFLEYMFTTNEQNPKVCEEVIGERSILLFSYYPECRNSIINKFHSFFGRNYQKLQSNLVKYVLAPMELPRNIRNFGATCYINSVIQLISEIDPICNQLLTYRGNNGSLEALKHILMRLKFSVKSSVKSKIILTSYELYEGCFIDKNVQSDAEEFLNTIIFKFEEERWDLEQCIKFKTSMKLICDCGQSFKKYDNSYILHLEVSGIETIEKSIQAYTKTTKIPDIDALVCETCQKKTIKQRQFTIEDWPNYLICVLKRFRYNLELGKPEKLMDEIALKNIIEIGENKYELFLIISHIGKTENGHYITLKKLGHIWYKIDDSSVIVLENFDPEKIETLNIGGEFTPYLLLFKKIGIEIKNEGIQIDTKLKEKNIEYCEACIYHGEPIVHFLSFMIDKNIEFCVYLLIYSLPYQEHDSKILFYKVYKKISQNLNDSNLKLQYLEKLKTIKSLQIIQILTGVANDNYKIVFESLLKEIYEGNSTELLNILFQILGNDHTSNNFTTVIDLIVQILPSAQDKENYIRYLMYYFLNRKVANYAEIELNENGIACTHFSSFFKYLYSENFSFNYEFKLENFYLFVNFYCFQINPKHYSKLMAKYIVENSLANEYFKFIIYCKINLQSKQRLVYDFIEELKGQNDLFLTEDFKSLIMHISSNEFEIKIIEKIIKAFSRKQKTDEYCFKIQSFFSFDKASSIPANEGIFKMIEENQNKINKLITDIEMNIVFEKKEKTDITYRFLDNEIEIDSFGQITMMSKKSSLKLVKSRF